VFAIQNRRSAEWMETYLLGLMSEVGELLTAMRWKKHRLNTVDEFGPGTLEELADITKYVISMWQLMGVNPEEMVDAVIEKTEFLDKMYAQEFSPKLKEKVVIFDLDDVLADLRTALMHHMGPKLVGSMNEFDSEINFQDWAKTQDLQTSIHLDEQFGMDFEQYRIAKLAFERNGGYRYLSQLYPLMSLFYLLQNKGYSIVVYTARPADLIKSIRRDTYMWFHNMGVMPDVIRFGREERITYALQLKKLGHRIVLVEDNPGLCNRARKNGLATIEVSKPYNTGTFSGSHHQLIDLIERLTPNDSSE
jgi:NTP pyrophosphatase (non-canonical NTP hydrolase)/FMN phosphatase YigB (HAD superfamily)